MLLFSGSADGLTLDDSQFRELRKDFDDIGTFVFEGSLRAKHLCVSDRLMCLIVTGDVRCERLSLFETEMLVMGSFTTKELKDPDEYLTVLGPRSVERLVGYGED